MHSKQWYRPITWRWSFLWAMGLERLEKIKPWQDTLLNCLTKKWPIRPLLGWWARCLQWPYWGMERTYGRPCNRPSEWWKCRTYSVDRLQLGRRSSRIAYHLLVEKYWCLCLGSYEHARNWCQNHGAPSGHRSQALVGERKNVGPCTRKIIGNSRRSRQTSQRWVHSESQLSELDL